VEGIKGGKGREESRGRADKGRGKGEEGGKKENRSVIIRGEVGAGKGGERKRGGEG